MNKDINYSLLHSALLKRSFTFYWENTKNQNMVISVFINLS